MSGVEVVMDNRRNWQELPLLRIEGPSPAEHRYYVLVLFDIADVKKYGKLIKVIKRYCLRIQKSVFEAYLHQQQINKLEESIRNLMCSQKYFNPEDRVRIYKLSGKPCVSVFGAYESAGIEENVFV